MKIDEMVEFEQLQSWLGYADQRSVVRWCEKRLLPILHFGLKRYVSSQLLTQYIDNQIVKFESGRKLSDGNSKIGNIKVEKSTSSKSKGSYQPSNEIVSKYLQKYETNNKSKTA